MYFLIPLLFLAVPAEDNVVIMLDTSSSMMESMGRQQGTKMEAAKNALLEVLRRMSPDTNVGLVTFRGCLIPLSPIDFNRAKMVISNQSPNGNTPLGQFMKDSADALLKKREESHGYGRYTLLVITDGEATDYDLMKKYTADIVSRGIVLKTIGVKMSTDHTLKSYSSNYFAANDAKALLQSVELAVAEIPITDSNSEDYSLLQSLPNDAVSKFMGAMNELNNRNYPIGEEPPSSPKVDVPQTENTISLGSLIGRAFLFGIIIVIFFVFFFVFKP